ncbi:MAG TPA: radical SAM protein, partial [Synergistales bacterium]|nr:radical SAM protein [Synergistales bacterium]
RVSGRESLTIAPEAGSDRLRFRCGKAFTNRQILEKLEMASSEGIRKAKLYFMVGLPTETEEDLVAIASLAESIRKELRLGVSLSVNVFVPKPGTSWENQPFVGVADAENRFRILKTSVSERLGKSCDVRFSSLREAELEYRLSWGGPEIVDLMEALVEKRRGGKTDAS